MPMRASRQKTKNDPKLPLLTPSLGRIVGTDPELSGCYRHQTCRPTLVLVAAAASLASVTEMALRGMSLICPPIFVQLGRSECNCSSLGGGEGPKSLVNLGDVVLTGTTEQSI